jgi:hypothetical protein
MKKIWTKHRIKQLEQLKQLIYEASAINKGNMVIERMKKVIGLAEALGSSDRLRARASFIRFLEEESFKEYNPVEDITPGPGGKRNR